MQLGSATLRWLAPLESQTALQRVIAVLLALGGALAAEARTGASELDFHVRGSVGQFFVIAAPAKWTVSLIDSKESVVQSGVTDDLGGFVFRNVTPAEGYYAVLSSQGKTFRSESATVFPDDYVPL